MTVVTATRKMTMFNEGTAMYGLAKNITDQRRREASEYRQAASVAIRRSLSFGRYRFTFDREPSNGPGLI